MREPLEEYVVPAIVHFMLYPSLISGTGPMIDTLISIVNNQFYQAVEIGPILDSTMLAGVRDILREARVECAYDGQPWTLIPGLDLGATDDAVREKAVTAMRRAIDQAEQLGSKTCGVMSGRLTEGLNQRKALDCLTESLVELCHYAMAKGITLCLENFDQVPFSKNCLVGPTVEAAKLSDKVRKASENFGLLLDLSHLPIMKETPRDAVLAARDQLVRVQIGNCSTNPYSPYYGDNHPYIGAPLTDIGVEQVAEFLSALVEVGFLRPGQKKVVGFEIKTGPSDNAQAIMVGSRRVLEKAWRMA
jgi:sugar phosphate isomerase/epimerase